MTPYTEADTLLKIEDVSKEYGGKLILRKLCATIKDIQVVGAIKGQIVGFIGLSGSGKTTLFRIMAGLEEPTSGRVILDGADRPVRAGEVGVVAQSYPLFAHRTVMGNLMRAARKTYPEKEARERVIAYLNDFDLSAEVNHYPAQLSGGQRQRCAILQQILCGATFILMDEPFSGLDPIAKKKTERLIQKIADLNERNTIVIVTHDIAAAASVSDHLWILGKDRNPDGQYIPGAYIVETYNLIDRGLAWDPNIEANPEFNALVREVNQKLEAL